LFQESTWRGRFTLAAILAIMALGITMLLAAPHKTEAQAAPSADIKQLTLTTAEENPPTTANATGTFSGTLRENSLDFDLSAVADNIIQAHIHQGAKGVNGPVVAFLFGPADPTVAAIHPTGTITVANLVGPLAGNWKGFSDAMAKGELYVNVHNTANPAGVVRAQIPATALPAAPVAPKPPATGSSASTGTGPSTFQITGGVLLTGALGALALYYVQRRRAA
jgi:hypothetical protein